MFLRKSKHQKYSISELDNLLSGSFCCIVLSYGTLYTLSLRKVL